jgi:hypothetical protein
MSFSIYIRFRLFISKLKTPTLIYYLHRKLFYLSNGKSNDLATSVIKIVSPKNPEIASVAVPYSSLTAKDIAERVNTDGYFQFEKPLDNETIARIIDFAMNEKLEIIKSYETTFKDDRKVSFSEIENLNSPRFDYDPSNLCKSEDVMNLVFERSFCNIAQEYFGSLPVMDPHSMWWSKPCDNKELQKQAAQLFHYDMDRIKFLKFFFYMTDVTAENGPHCFVRGSHKNLNSSLRRDGRFEDSEVENAYGKEAIVNFCAPKGTIIAVDTRGLHKGLPLKSGNRLILQLMYANSTFGQYYPAIKFQHCVSSKLILQKIHQHPLIFGPVFQLK